MGKVAAGQGTAVWRGTETKTRYCQPLRHRNRHPPRETLNHFYCIELSLLPAERTSKRAPSLSPLPPAGYLFLPLFCLFLPRLSPGHSRPSSFVGPHLPAGYALFPLSPPPVSDGREIIRTRKRSHPFGCPNGISSLIRGFTAEQTNRPRCRRDNIRRTKEGRFLAANFSFAFPSKTSLGLVGGGKREFLCDAGYIFLSQQSSSGESGFIGEK